MQAASRRLSVVSATSCNRRRLIRVVRRLRRVHYLEAMKALVIILPLLLLVDWWSVCFGSRVFHYRAKPPAVRPALTTEERAFLTKEYDTVAAETKMRIDHEFSLFRLKFTLVGAVLAAIVAARGIAAGAAEERGVLNSSITAISAWAAVFVAALVDLRRQWNSNIIMALSDWVQHVEGALLPPGITGWEQYIPTSGLWNDRFYPLLRIERELMTWVLFAVVVVLFIPTKTTKSPDRDRRIFQIALGGGLATIIAFGLHALHFHYSEPVYVSVLTIATLALCACYIYAVRRQWLGLKRSNEVAEQ